MQKENKMDVVISMEATISADAFDKVKVIEHHAERLLDLGNWPEIETVFGVTVEEANKSIDSENSQLKAKVAAQKELLNKLIENHQIGRTVEETIAWCLFVGFKPEDLVEEFNFDKEDVEEAVEDYNRQ
jgi:hypothetical protein